MLKIRLAKVGRKKRPSFRIVLTEHTKPAHAGYQDILGLYNPFTKETSLNLDLVKKYINNGAKPTSRVAKIAYNHTKEDLFKKYFVHQETKRTTKNPDKYTK